MQPAHVAAPRDPSTHTPPPDDDPPELDMPDEPDELLDDAGPVSGVTAPPHATTMTASATSGNER